ncbi:type II toxin-antitoxin system mRNA interferase toxin, RelE/StbE family [bacterium]|nr:type II toxin-antitoxin system mRNA interferase toxin, RelE/StbE family [bacterium]
MNKWKMRFTPESSRLLSKLHPEKKKLIKRALTELRQNPYMGKNLHEELSGFKSLRLKQYRIIYNIDEENKFIQVYHIGQRRDVYEQLKRLLTGFQNS